MGRSRSLEIAPFSRVHTSIYQPSIATMSLLCTVVEIQNNIYTVSQKKGATLTMAITLSILGVFAKFFHGCKEQ